MLDLKVLRENPEPIKKALKKKFVEPTLVDNVLGLDAEKRLFQQEMESLKARQNEASKFIPKAAPEEKEKLLREMQIVKEQAQEAEKKFVKAEDELKNLLNTLPNPPHESVPEGQGDEMNEVVQTWGKMPTWKSKNGNMEPRDHAELGRALNLMDFDHAAQMSGSRFVYLKNEAVLLEFALVQFVLQKLIKKGFTPIVPPVLVKEHAMFATGFFPADRNEIYHVNAEDDDLYLVGTSEVSLAMLHANEIVKEKDLPLRYAAFSTCFRREAGSYGKDTQGMIRVHQFDKVEMFSFCHPDKSVEEHEFLRSIEEEILQELGIPYQVVNVCGGELGAPAAKKYDTEGWIPSQKKYRELMSCSNCTDFQARRAHIRFENNRGEKEVVHTLNGTACAVGRMLVAIFENYQNEKGEIEVPKALQKISGLQVIKPSKKATK